MLIEEIILNLLELQQDHCSWMERMDHAGIEFQFQMEPPGNDYAMLNLAADIAGVPPDDWDDETESGYCRDWLIFDFNEIMKNKHGVIKLMTKMIGWENWKEDV